VNEFLGYKVYIDEPICYEDEEGNPQDGEAFTGIGAKGRFPDGRKFGIMIPATRELFEDTGIDAEAIAREAIDEMTPEDIGAF
jgi:hypothetical protein